jgi:hypothetical protein
MSQEEVSDLLHRSAPSLDRQETTVLAELCQGWPLLASVVGANVEQDLSDGAHRRQAVTSAVQALSTAGPPAFDVWDADQRKTTLGHAITATARNLATRVTLPGVPAGLDERYFSLAIFPAATPIPLSVLATVCTWRAAPGCRRGR